MGVRITLTDDVLPPSSAFIDFLENWIAKTVFDGLSWAETGRERVPLLGRDISTGVILARAEKLVESDEGRRHLSRAYDLFVALLIGDVAALQAFQEKYRFILVVGVPRSGGKYITKQLYRALGRDPRAVPAVLAHDISPMQGRGGSAMARAMAGRTAFRRWPSISPWWRCSSAGQTSMASMS